MDPNCTPKEECLTRRPGGRARSRLGLGAALALAALAGGCAPKREASLPGAGVAELPEHYAHSLAALGWPGAHRAFQVGSGSVISSGESALEWRLDPESGPVTVSPVWFERDGVPVAHWTMAAGGTRLEFEAAAAPLPALGETSLVASVHVTALGPEQRPSDVGFRVLLSSAPDGPHVLPWDAPERFEFAEAWRGRAMLRNGRMVALVDSAASVASDAPAPGRPAHFTGEGPGSLAAHFSAHLAAGERRSWDFVMPLYPTLLASGTLEVGAAHDAVASQARGFWRQVLGRAAQLSTPDRTVNAAWRAAIVTLVTCQERDQSHWVPIGSPFQYRDVWLRDGARAVRALAITGLDDFAGDDARTLSEYALPTGALLSQVGQLDGTGQALWAFEQACTFGGDRALARELLPVARHGLEWIQRQRRATAALAMRWPGLLPFGDPRDAELVRGELVGNDAWAIAGCDAVASLARRAGDAALARQAEAEASDYRSRFSAALASTHTADVPPSWSGVGRDWGNLSAGYPTRALPANDPRLAELARRVLVADGRAGLSHYGPVDSLHTYNGADLAIGEMLAGQPAYARAWRDSLLAHSSSTLGQAEIFDRRSGSFGTNLPPHATAAAAVVDLLRNMLVADDGDMLELAAGADASWWSGTTLANAPTRFGAVTLQLDRPAPARLRVRLDPLPVPLRVHVPEGSRAVSVRSPGASLAPDGSVLAPARTRVVEFDVEPRPGEGK